MLINNNIPAIKYRITVYSKIKLELISIAEPIADKNKIFLLSKISSDLIRLTK